MSKTKSNCFIVFPGFRIAKNIKPALSPFLPVTSLRTEILSVSLLTRGRDRFHCCAQQFQVLRPPRAHCSPPHFPLKAFYNDL